MNETPNTNNTEKLQPYLSPLAVWAISVGSAIGWGSLVVTSSSYLSEAGPMGSVIGLLIGAGVMLMVASHYHFLANHYGSSAFISTWSWGYTSAWLIIRAFHIGHTWLSLWF